MDDNNQWVKVFTSPSEVLIALLKGKLHEAQIPAVESSKKDTVYNVIGEINLMVPQDHLQGALHIVEQFKDEGEFI
jgi:hypothetical protein